MNTRFRYLYSSLGVVASVCAHNLCANIALLLVFFVIPFASFALQSSSTQASAQVGSAVSTIASDKHQRIIDSLSKRIKTHSQDDSVKIALTLELSQEYIGIDAEKAMRVAEEALEMAKNQGLKRSLARSKNAVGVAARIQGLYAVAASLHFDALEISKQMQDEEGIARALHNIGRVYEVQRENGKALEYLRQALVKREELVNLRDIAETMHYMGNCFGNQREFDSAMKYYSRAMLIRREVFDARGIGVLHNNIGWIFRLQQRYDTALTLFQRAFSIFDSLDDTRGKALALDNIGVVYFQQQKYPESIQTLEQALRFAEIAHDRREVNDLYAALANSNEAAGQFREANSFRRLRDALKDSLFNERSAKLVAELNSRYEDEKREQQIKILTMDAEQIKLQRYLWLVMALLGLGAIGFLLYNNRLKARSNERLRQKSAEVAQHAKEVEAINAKMMDVNHELAAAYEEADTLNEHLTNTLQALEFEKANADSLLLNILPAAIAERLKNGELTFAQRYSATTILFADLVGFTQLAASMAPEELVQILSEVFVMFDNVLERNGCEKIKTIGDCYMMASGLPNERPDHAIVAARTAFELLLELNKFNEMFRTDLRLRIGMHTGPVVAGVIGRKKFAFDIWGDTVNIASRMESHGEPNKIHCTEDVYALLNEQFIFEERGQVEIKGRGKMNTYFMIGETKNHTSAELVSPLSIEL
jgi:class 3 adenylate cyclase/tetratricopeptide (TPR) repeat protein